MDNLATMLIDWYDEHARSLPWRGQSDPYLIWISEVMLQQTRVDTVLRYYARWVEKFPDLFSLAASTEHDVLVVWEGLGYYSRARNLLKTAKLLVEKYNGIFPVTAAELKEFPGIGRYTAGAISSIAFGQPEPIVDGNIKRVYSRIFNLTLPINSPQGEEAIWDYAKKSIPKNRVGDFNQALMELGAIICLPQKPKCLECPIVKLCIGKKVGVELFRPVVLEKKAIPLIHFVGFILSKEGSVLMIKNPSKGLLGGLWQYPSIKSDDGNFPDLISLPETARSKWGMSFGNPTYLGEVRHAYTHFRVLMMVYHCVWLSGEPFDESLTWVTTNSLENLPMGRISRRICMLLGESTDKL